MVKDISTSPYGHIVHSPGVTSVIFLRTGQWKAFIIQPRVLYAFSNFNIIFSIISIMCSLGYFRRYEKPEYDGMRGSKLRFIHWEDKCRVGPGKL